LLTRIVEPSGKYTNWGMTTLLLAFRGIGKSLANLGECYLEICTVGKITITANGASYTATEIGLAVESLLN